MSENKQGTSWEQFNRAYYEFPALNLAIDLSKTMLEPSFFQGMNSQLDKAFAHMRELEAGAIANPDENRMVGHYWLRNPGIAPRPELRREIEETIQAVKSFTQEIHGGTLRGANGSYTKLLVIGIGGSALGPQFVATALGLPGRDRLQPYFFDNTDPDGMEKTLASIGSDLGRTLCIVISKSGGTKETRNGMLEARHAFQKSGLNFEKQAVAITGVDSELDKLAVADKWLRRFPMWDWVGGRTSQTSAVGLLPAALQGLDIDGLLRGAAACDEATRKNSFKENPAAQLALAWFGLGSGKGEKAMVVLPYKDRLELFSKYLQQLIMESLGKEKDLNGKVVNQGLSVYGNKGSTDQHAYIQQLREGLNNFFVTFIEVLKDRSGPPLEVEPNTTSGDYLEGFFLGTRQALFENGRPSITLTIQQVDASSVGMLIALYERAVGLYAHLIGINAYHQPGVEAGKKAASAVLQIQMALIEQFKKESGKTFSVDELSQATGKKDAQETIYKICMHLAANGRLKKTGAGPAGVRFQLA
ncbi:MAG: glucose-6-phosphate isomerase [Verrucomicrobiales bacterium]